MMIPLLALSMVLFIGCSGEEYQIDLPKTDPWVEKTKEEELTFNGVPIGILDRLIQSESSWRPTVESKTDHEHSVGLAQVNMRWMSYFSAKYGIRNPKNPYESLEFASKYLMDLYRATGSWYLAVLAYKCGIGGIHRAPLYIKRISWWVANGDVAP